MTNFLRHRIALRPDFDVEITLPRDLASAEALRIMDVLRSLCVDPCGQPHEERTTPFQGPAPE